MHHRHLFKACFVISRESEGAKSWFTTPSASASLSLALGLRNQFHTRPLSAFFELLRRKNFLLFLLKQAHFYLTSFVLSCVHFPLCFLLFFLFFFICSGWNRSLSTLLVVRAKLSSASFSSTSKLLERLIQAHSTHSLNIPKFFNTSPSGCSPAAWVTWLLWNSSGSCNLPHLRTFPRPSCGTCSWASLAATPGHLLPAFSHAFWLVNAGILKLLSLDPCSSFYPPVDLTHSP